jgi:hypothetical protein
MKAIKIPFLAFILLLVTFGICSGDKILKDKFDNLVLKYKALYMLETKVINEIEGITPEAVKAFTEAKKVMDTTEPDKLTKDEKIIILTAAYLSERLKGLYCQLALIHWNMHQTEEEAYNTKKQLDSEREA